MATLARTRVVDWTVLATGLSLLGVACSSDPSGSETGQDSTAGGSSSTGGGAGVIGTTGGATGSSAGGTLGAGGNANTGGRAVGGQVGAGGTQASGGRTGTGGAIAAGGNVGAGGSASGGVSTNVGGAAGGSCVPGVQSGDVCDPVVDVAPCERSDRTCVCAAGQSTWSCTPSTGGSGGSGGGGTGVGGVGAGGSSVGAGGSSVGGGGSSVGGGGGNVGVGGGNVGGGGGDVGVGGGGDAGSGQGGGSAVGGSSGIDDYNGDGVEFVGEDCDLPEPELLSSGDHSLPDPFLMPDGSRMSSISQWACQRAWLKKNIEAFVHGAKPGKPDVVSGSVSTDGVTIHVENGGSKADFSIPIDLPPGASGPVPGMFQADGSGVPTSFLHGEGVAAMNYSHSDAEGAFNSLYSGASVDLTIKWAWAVSRAIDVLVAERDAGRNDIIDPTALGTTGCSYAGKSAFTVGAFDERIALGIPMESGTGGLGSYRVVGDKDLGPNGGEDPEQVSEACGHTWFTGTICSGNVDTIPADAHFMVAMYAPRGFTTLDNNRIGHLGPVAQFTADSAGAEVFKALGVESHIGYHGGNDTDPHGHCSWNQSQEETASAAIRGFLTKTQAPANFMEPKLKNQNDQPVDFNLTDYIKWTTPTLE